MIVLVSPRDSYLEEQEIPVKPGDRVPLGIIQLGAFIKKFGYEIKYFDLNHDSKEDLFKFIEDNMTKFICITINTPNYHQCIELAKRLKSKDNKIIAGGMHVSNFPNEETTLKHFDHIIVGDGEESLLSIVEEREEKQIIYSKKFEPLDQLPIPDYAGIKFERYFFKQDGRPGALVNSSRGCVFSCCFCGSSTIKKWRPRSPEHVMKELRILVNVYKKESIYFCDDIFTFDKQRVIKLCEMIKMEFPNLTWRATTRADLLNDELCATMKSAGCNWISLGIESGSDKVLKKINKFMNVKQQEQGIDMCIRNGINVRGFHIFPLPGDDKETIQETINWTKKLKEKYGNKYNHQLYPLVPYYNTPLWNNPEKFGMKIMNTTNWEDYNQIIKNRSQPLFIHENFSEEEIQYWYNKFQEEVGENAAI